MKENNIYSDFYLPMLYSSVYLGVRRLKLLILIEK